MEFRKKQTFVLLNTGPFQNIKQRLALKSTNLNGVDSLPEAWLAGAALYVVDDDTVGVGAARVGLALLAGLHAGQRGRVTLEPRTFSNEMLK